MRTAVQSGLLQPGKTNLFDRQHEELTLGQLAKISKEIGLRVQIVIQCGGPVVIADTEKT